MIPILVSGIEPSVVTGLTLKLEGVSVDQVDGPRDIVSANCERKVKVAE